MPNNVCQYIHKQHCPCKAMFLLFENGLDQCGGKITLSNIANMGLFCRL